MKLKLLGAGLLLALASLAQGWATTGQQRSCAPKPHRFEIGANYTYAWVTPQTSDSVKGSMGGAQALYEYRPLDSAYVGCGLNYRIGTPDNDVGKRKLQDVNSQLRVGYTFAKEMVGSDYFTLFTGVGARYMPEKVTVGTASLDVNYVTFYVPVGFLAEHHISPHFTMGLNFQWMPQVFPTVSLEPLGGARWDLKYQLPNFFVEVPFKYTSRDQVYALSINPFFEAWRDGKSTAETLTHLLLALPGNRYIFVGVNVNFDYSF